MGARALFFIFSFFEFCFDFFIFQVVFFHFFSFFHFFHFFHFFIFYFFIFSFFHFFHFFIFFIFSFFFIFSYFFMFFHFFRFFHVFSFFPPRGPRGSLQKHRSFLFKNLNFKARIWVKERKNADRNRSPSTIALTGPFCCSRAWKPLTPTLCHGSRVASAGSNEQ